jgi:hypothetical protein
MACLPQGGAGSLADKAVRTGDKDFHERGKYADDWGKAAGLSKIMRSSTGTIYSRSFQQRW